MKVGEPFFMNKSLKYFLQLLLVLAVGFVGGVLGSTLSNQLLTTTGDQTSTSTTKVNGKSYSNTTSTTEAVNKVKDAVVSVINYQEGSASDYEEQSIFEDSQAQKDGLIMAGQGSGVIYKKENGKAFLVTNTHVLAGAEAIEIKLSDGSMVEAELVGSDTYSDIAVVKIDDDKVKTVAEFGDSSKLNVGETVIAIGSPLGTEYANSVTQGIVSSLSRTVTSESEDGQTISTKAIQTDAAINPGNSGGPLINIQGQVIGITSSKIATSADGVSSGVSVEGMGFAIPAKDVVSISETLEKNGKVTRPALGITMTELAGLNASDLQRLDIPDDLDSGVVVTSIQPGLSADGILEKYDVITKIDDTKIEVSTDLQSALYDHAVGDTITVTFYRDGKEKTEKIKLTSSTNDLDN